VDTEQDRVILIRTVVQFMATKAHIKLNPKKLYQSDGYSVKELLKVTSVLYSAMKSNSASGGTGEGGPDSSALPTFDIGSKLAELKQTRKLGTAITMKGAALYDLLGREVELRERRQAVLARSLEIQEVEAGLRSSAQHVGEETAKVQHNIENVAANEANLEAKIEKKKVELERNQARLATLKKVRPAFMDEYEKLEGEMRKCYEEYMVSESARSLGRQTYSQILCGACAE
jgi:clusterin-associated protein 1